MTLAVFILLGNCPVWNDRLQMCANGLEIPVITLLTVFMSMSSQSMEVLFLHLNHLLYLVKYFGMVSYTMEQKERKRVEHV
jgi:hypothetical protein